MLKSSRVCIVPAICISRMGISAQDLVSLANFALDRHDKQRFVSLLHLLCTDCSLLQLMLYFVSFCFEIYNQDLR